jgi:hypothetical protein
MYSLYQKTELNKRKLADLLNRTRRVILAIDRKLDKLRADLTADSAIIQLMQYERGASLLRPDG